MTLPWKLTASSWLCSDLSLPYYDYLCILPPNGDCIARMSPRISYLSVINRFCDGIIVVKGRAIPDPSLEVDDTGSGVRSYF